MIIIHILLIKHINIIIKVNDHLAIMETNVMELYNEIYKHMMYMANVREKASIDTIYIIEATVQ